MFTEEEQPLLTGDNEDMWEFVDYRRCMVIDWRGTEDETIDAAIQFLPDGALTYETTFPGNDNVTIRIRFRDREDSVSLPFQHHNNFRVLLRLCRLLQPDYDIKLFRCTDGSDTHGFLLRPTEWWTAYRSTYPQQYERVFRDVSALNELWPLETPSRPVVSKPTAAKTKAWLGNIGISFLVAAVIATVLSLIVIGISLITRTWYFERYHASTWQIIGTYYAAGTLISLPIGLALPFARRLLVTALLGAFGGIVTYAMVGYSIDGSVRWLIALPLGIFVGVPVALVVRSGILADQRKTTVVSPRKTAEPQFPPKLPRDEPPPLPNDDSRYMPK